MVKHIAEAVQLRVTKSKIIIEQFRRSRSAGSASRHCPVPTASWCPIVALGL